MIYFLLENGADINVTLQIKTNNKFLNFINKFVPLFRKEMSLINGFIATTNDTTMLTNIMQHSKYGIRDIKMALSIAVANNNTTMFKFLLSTPIGANIKNNLNNENNGNNYMGDYVRSGYVDPVCIAPAIINNNIEILKLLINIGVDVNNFVKGTFFSIFGRINKYPIHIAIEQCNIECIKLLVNSGANVDTKCIDILNKISQAKHQTQVSARDIQDTRDFLIDKITPLTT